MSAWIDNTILRSHSSTKQHRWNTPSMPSRCRCHWRRGGSKRTAPRWHVSLAVRLRRLVVRYKQLARPFLGNNDHADTAAGGTVSGKCVRNGAPAKVLRLRLRHVRLPVLVEEARDVRGAGAADSVWNLCVTMVDAAEGWVERATSRALRRSRKRRPNLMMNGHRSRATIDAMSDCELPSSTTDARRRRRRGRQS